LVRKGKTAKRRKNSKTTKGNTNCCSDGDKEGRNVTPRIDEKMKFKGEAKEKKKQQLAVGYRNRKDKAWRWRPRTQRNVTSLKKASTREGTCGEPKKEPARVSIRHLNNPEEKK